MAAYVLQCHAVTQRPEEKARPRTLSDIQIGSLIAQTGCLALALVIGSVAGGILLDRALGTRPMFTLLLVLGSAPLTMFVLYRFAMRTVGKPQNDGPTGVKGSHVDDDE